MLDTRLNGTSHLFYWTSFASNLFLPILLTLYVFQGVGDEVAIAIGRGVSPGRGQMPAAAAMLPAAMGGLSLSGSGSGE